MSAWSEIIESSLGELNSFLQDSEWFGRENEVVSLYAHEFLPRRLKEGSVFTSLSQIGIEVAVPQVTGNVKKYVRKDMVIWNKPMGTIWTERSPAVIVEWKVNRLKNCEKDIQWLKLFTTRYPETLGYSVCAFIKRNRGVEYTKVVA